MLTTEIRAITDANPATTQLQDLHYHVAQNLEYQQLKKVILNDFPDHQSQLHELCNTLAEMTT